MANIDPQHEEHDRDQVAENLYQLASECLLAYRDVHTGRTIRWADVGEQITAWASRINAGCARLVLLERLTGRLAPGGVVPDESENHIAVEKPLLRPSNATVQSDGEWRGPEAR
jgi:hypothetical protein